ncbi:MAG: hypothetical protein II525_05180 [Bacteroidales bacterium]|nr:hypothetical protein [Bacteroidales bacterium]
MTDKDLTGRLRFLSHVGVLYAMLMAAILLLLCLRSRFPRAAGYYLMPEEAGSYLPLLLSGVAVLGALYVFCRLLFRNARRCKAVAVVTGLLFLLIQLFLIYGYYFETDWDVQQLVGAARASAAGDGEALQGYSWYFSECPNNLFLTGFFALVFRICGLFGLHGLFLLLALQCLSGTLVSWMLFQTLFRACDAPTAFFGQLLFLLFVGLSPWFSIPYSDTASLIFIMGMVWLAMTSVLSLRPRLKWFLLAFLAGVGYAVKPQTLLVFIALLPFCWPRSGKNIIFSLSGKKRSAVLPLLLAGFVSACLLTAVVGKSTGISRQKEPAFGTTHYLLIGMNSRTMGDYAPEDVEFSRSYPTRLARAKAELQEMGRRVKAMGVSGFFRHLCEKNILTYGDGTFSWGKEGKFFHTLFPEKGRPFASFSRKVYYTREYGGVYYPFFCIMSLIFWLGILFWSVVGGLIGREPLTNALCLTLLLLAVFEMLFECRARYLFGFTPLYLMCASMAFYRAKNNIKNKKVGFVLKK